MREPVRYWRRGRWGECHGEYTMTVQPDEYYQSYTQGPLDYALRFPSSVYGTNPLRQLSSCATGSIAELFLASCTLLAASPARPVAAGPSSSIRSIWNLTKSPYGRGPD
jgi:hypothetical protein